MRRIKWGRSCIRFNSLICFLRHLNVSQSSLQGFSLHSELISRVVKRHLMRSVRVFSRVDLPGPVGPAKFTSRPVLATKSYFEEKTSPFFGIGPLFFLPSSVGISVQVTDNRDGGGADA